MKHFFLGVVMVASLSLSGLMNGWDAFTSPAHPSIDTGSTTWQTCAHYTNHVYEVCSAYILNAAHADLQPYYKYVHDPNSSVAGFVSYRLGSRYTGGAQRLITQRVANWPSGVNEVDGPDIRILSVTSSLQHNRATLATEESWTVRSASGAVLYQENHVRHTVTMARVPSYLLHKWVVTDIR
ncbi:MAG TPA: hypothetical protein VFH39_00685 [Candidatus Saccharimonadales bacterium]|nr:hypothetical protein [Candidatus Saccharimonadales bacterium]